MLRINRILNIKYLIFLVFLFSCFFAFGADATDYIQPEIKVYSDSGNKIDADFLAFDKNFKGGAYPAIGDVNNDGKDEIVIGAGYGGGPQVRIFNKKGDDLGINFFAFNKNYTSGVNVAVCNLDGKGRNKIVVGKALEDKSEIAIFKISKISKISNFVAYDESFEGGVNIACADINKDGKDEIVAGPGPSGRAHIRIFKFKPQQKDVEELSSFFAFKNSFEGGVTVAAAGNKIIVGQQTKGNLIKVYKIKQKSLKPKLIKKIIAFNDFSGGVNIGFGKFDNNKNKIFTAPNSGGGPNIKVFDLNGRLLKSLDAYAEDFRGGVRIANLHKFSTNSINKKKKSLFFVVAPGFKQSNKCEKNCVALTFDDGYSSASGSFDHILDTLKSKKARATFFMLGVVMKGYPDRMLRIDREGHQLANHSYSHGSFTMMSTGQIINEITYTDQIAKSITGKPTKPYFRYPGGSHNLATDAIVKNLGYKYFDWTASAGDSSPNVTVQSATWGMLWNLHDGSIILAHTMKDATAAALPIVIDAIRRAGYNLATLDEMRDYWNIGY